MREEDALNHAAAYLSVSFRVSFPLKLKKKSDFRYQAKAEDCVEQMRALPLSGYGLYAEFISSTARRL